MNVTGSSPRNLGPTRRESLALLLAAMAIPFVGSVSQALASEKGSGATPPGASTQAGTSPTHGTAGNRDVSSGGRQGGAGTASQDAASTSPGASSGSTVESNKVKRFSDIPADALIGIEDLHDLIEDGALEDGTIKVVDIRSHRDYQKVQIAGSRNIPAGRQIEIRIDEIPTDRTVVLIAYKNSDRLAETWFTLVDHGYDPDLLKVADGGVHAWANAGYPTLKNQFLGC